MDEPYEADAKTLALMRERDEFLDHIANGTPPILAGIEVGWSPYRTKTEMSEKGFAELIAIHLDMSIDSVERALHKSAVGGNIAAMQMILYNRRGDKWRDVKRIEVRQEITHNIGSINATKAAALELLREAGPAALQPGSALDIIDAEVVDDVA